MLRSPVPPYPAARGESGTDTIFVFYPEKGYRMLQDATAAWGAGLGSNLGLMMFSLNEYWQ